MCLRRYTLLGSLLDFIFDLRNSFNDMQEEEFLLTDEIMYKHKKTRTRKRKRRYDKNKDKTDKCGLKNF